VKKILNGYVSLFREMLNLQNDASFLSPTAGLVTLIAICGGIGLVRNMASTYLQILPGFYNFQPDILWTMFNFPIHLWLFGGMLLHWQLRLLGYRDLNVVSIFALAFHLQILHLIVPFLDWVGYYRLGMPWEYILGPHPIANEWYTNIMYYTPGIIVGWWITAYATARTLRLRLEISWFAIILASFSTFIIMAIPKDIIFPTTNTLFNRAFGPWLWSPLKYLTVFPKWFPFWGYGTYYALSWIFGLVYYLRYRSRNSQ
jgi:hypothetical protein